MRLVIYSLFLLLPAISAFGMQPDQKICALNFAELATVNSPDTGIVVKQVKGWYSEQDIKSIKDSYPQPKETRRGKIVVFSSEPEAATSAHFKKHPEYLNFYQSNAALKSICEKMHAEILESIPADERKSWEKKKWVVSLQWSDGTEPLQYDHVHRDSVVASLTLEGIGTIAKIPGQDISKMDSAQIYSVADGMPGQTYQATEGDLMIINGVHYAGGGLHAAPQSGGAFPGRLTILVGIEK